MVSNNFDLSRALLNCNRGGPSCSLGLKWEGVVRDVDVSKSQRHEPRRSKAKGCTPPKQPLTVPLPQRVFQLAVNEAQQELVPLRRLHLPQPAGVQSLGFSGELLQQRRRDSAKRGMNVSQPFQPSQVIQNGVEVSKRWFLR